MGFKIKKTVNDETVWEPIKAKKYTASKITEHTGALPITINANGGPLIDYRIYGNTEQTGTPTPENPIMPESVGERVDITGLSEPLCGIQTYTDSLDLSTGILTRQIKKLVLTGEETVAGSTLNGGWIVTNLPTNMVNTTDVITAICSHYKAVNNTFMTALTTGDMCISTNSHNRINFATDISTAADFKTYLAAQYAAGTPVTIWYVLADPDVSTIPIPSGLTGTIEGYLIQNDTPTPETPIYPTANGVKQADDTYAIPYGYKLPILSNSTVTNIYLGEVETTRRIKKLVLTGEETYQSYAYNNTYGVQIANVLKKSYRRATGLCNIYPVSTVAGSTHCLWIGSGGYDRHLYFISILSDMGITDASEFESWVAQQYHAGTPVTVWYVLAEPETGIVNEPLMKIGDYADTVSMEQAGVSIPTNKGTTIIDYDGALKPSQMYIKYNSWSGWSDIDNYKMVNGDWTQEMT